MGYFVLGVVVYLSIGIIQKWRKSKVKVVEEEEEVDVNEDKVVHTDAGDLLDASKKVMIPGEG